MLKANRDSKIGTLISSKRLLLVGLGCSMVINLCLSIGVTRLVGTERIVLLWPTTDQDIWINSKQASSAYLKELSQYLLMTTLNVTPQTITSRRSLLLSYVHPSGYGEIKNQLLEEEDIVKKRNICKMFAPLNFEIEENSLKVKVVGELSTWVSKEKISQEKVSFSLQYRMNAGKLQLVEFKEDPHESAV